MSHLEINLSTRDVIKYKKKKKKKKNYPNCDVTLITFYGNPENVSKDLVPLEIYQII